MTDSLSRLCAGLDRDEAIARITDRPDWDVTPEGSVWDNSGWVADVGGDLGQHVARHDPRRALRQSEVFRKLIRLQEEAERDSLLSDRDTGFEAGVSAALELLASIYPEDTTETETP